MLRKQRNFGNFLNYKIVNLSDSSKESIVYANKIFNDFRLKIHRKAIDQVIIEAKQDDESDRIVFVSDKNHEGIKQINEIVDSRK